MKQLNQLITPRTAGTPTVLSRRLLMGQVFLGGAAALVLSACGGGGGGTDDSRNLRAALDRLNSGMNIAQIIAAVGWEPNDGQTSWDNGEEWLLVTTRPTDDYTDNVISGAIWHMGSARIQRSYK
jgi:hypothetical protein